MRAAPELTRLVEFALDHAKKLGANAAEAAVSTSKGLTATVRMGEVESLEYHKDRGVGVTVYLDGAKGNASSSDFSQEAIAKTVEAAVHIARHTAADPCEGLADPELLAKEIPDLDLYHPWDIDADRAIDLALQCEKAAFDYDARIKNSDGCSVTSGEGEHIYGTTQGFLAGYPSARHSVSCSVIAQEGEQMQRDDWYEVRRLADNLPPLQDIGQHAARRAIARLGSQKQKTCAVPVLFENQAALSLLGHLSSAISGSNLYRKTSFLLDALDTEIFPSSVHIFEEPRQVRGLGSAPFDHEGVATQNRDIVSNGVLRSYSLGSYSACKLGMRSTGNAGGLRNLTWQAGDGGDLAALCKTMGRGVLVTELIGFGVNQVTGDYSRGVAGFWVENGEIQFPVEEITIAGNLKDMFKGIAVIGSDLIVRGGGAAPSVLIEGMTIAGE